MVYEYRINQAGLYHFRKGKALTIQGFLVNKNTVILDWLMNA